MEAVNGIGASGLGASLTSATQSSLGKEDFLKLPVAQLAHQDPLSPMENQEFVAQLAQFSSLEQMTNVNSNLQLLQVAQASMTNSQIASLIGKNVEVRSDQVRLLGSGRAAVNFDLGATAKEVEIRILDANGNTVRTLKEGGKTAGLNSVQWDGKDNLGNVLPPANYKVEVSAKDSNGNAVAASTRFEGMVSGVSFEQGIPLLEINGAKVSVGDVLTVRQAPATQQGGASTP